MTEHLPTQAESLDADRGRIEQELDHVLVPHGPRWVRVRAAMRYAVLGRGKRIRPLLALRVARMLSAETEDTVRLAAAIELIHSASLIVDDLPCMDDDRLRRDAPTTHVASGEALAILAAFSLVTQAVRSILETPTDEAGRDRLVAFQAEFLKSLDFDGLIAGQALDLGLGQALDSRAHAERLEVANLKTVPLFMLSVNAGGLFAEVPPLVRDALNHFAREFGRLYQILDDVADGDAPGDRVDSESVWRYLDRLESFGLDGSGLREVVHESCADRAATLSVNSSFSSRSERLPAVVLAPG